MKSSFGLPAALAAVLGVLAPAPSAQAPAAAPQAASPQLPPGAAKADPTNPYGYQPWKADFPVALEYPRRNAGKPYDRTRRQAIERVVANLQGNVRREVWQFATEFFWRAPDDAAEPLIEAMDRAFSDPSLQDVVKNTVEAMGKMGGDRFDEPIRRALEHPAAAVQQAAFTALANAGKPETVAGLRRAFGQMDGRARTAWLRAVRVRLGAQGVPILESLMMADLPTSVRDAILKETLELPTAQAAVVLRGRWPQALGEFKAVIAGVLHANGEVAGTAWLREAMGAPDPKVTVLALRHSARGALGALREDVLRLSTHPRPEVRLEVARALQKEEGDDIARVYESLAGPEEAWEVKTIAVRQLVRRGKPAVVGDLLREIETATGTELGLLLGLVSASGDPRAVPLFVDRFRESPSGEGRQFLQAISHGNAPQAMEAFAAIFREPDRPVTDANREGHRLTTWNYVPMLMMNLRGQEDGMLALWRALPREDHVRRAYLLERLSGVAADREDPALKSKCEQPVRDVLMDATELPQMRILALTLLGKRSFTLDDAMALKRRARSDDEPLRLVFADYLDEYF